MSDRAYGRNFGRVPDELLWDTTVSDRACRLYAALTRYSQQRDRVVPPRPELASRLGWSVDKLDRVIAELEKAGALYVERHTHAKGETGSRTRESTYWLDGTRPDGDPSRNSAATPSRKNAANDSRKNAATIEKRETSSNEDGASHRDGRADTITGKAIDALGFTPVERGAFAKILTEASATVLSETVLLGAVKEWGRKGEPVSYLAGYIGQADRAARARSRANGNGNGHRDTVRHDGQHDPGCWCYQVPEDKRAKVKRGDLLRAAGMSEAAVRAEMAAEDEAARAEGRCCASHTRTCEPPSELCCKHCSEARHPEHPEGVPCVLVVQDGPRP